jgi:hypothetical protein
VEPDPLLRRIGRTAVVLCLLMAFAALFLSRSPVMSALAVLGGGLIVGASYRAIQSGVTALVDRIAAPQDAARTRPSLRREVIKLTGRYALLGFAAYVMIGRLRLPPLGLLAGASSIVTAVAVEAARFLFKKDLASRT